MLTWIDSNGEDHDGVIVDLVEDYVGPRDGGRVEGLPVYASVSDLLGACPISGRLR